MDRRVRRTRMLIKNAFLELLQEKELSTLTITELTKRADIDRRTFYLHYSCIEDIIVDIEKETSDTLHQLLLSMKEFDINIFFESITQIVNDNLDFWRTISTNDNYHRFLAKCKEHLKELIYEIFYNSSQLSREDFEIYSEYVASGILGLYTNWLVTNSTMTLDELTLKAEAAVAYGWNMLTANS